MSNDESHNFSERMLAAADAAARAGESGYRSSADLLASMYGAALGMGTEAEALGARVAPLGPGLRPSATTLFRTFALGLDGTAANRALARFFEVLAVPGSLASSIALTPGDLLIRVARAEGWGNIAFVASRRLCSAGELAGAGLRGERYPRLAPGSYVHVVEIRPRRRPAQDRFARRIADASGLILSDTLLLRPLAPPAFFGGAEGAEAQSDRPVLRRGAQGPAVVEAQRKLNRFHADSTALGLPGFPDGPLAENGRFGQAMERAVLFFQQQVLPDAAQWDGIIGPQTWAQLDLLAGAAETPPLVPARGSAEATGDIPAVAGPCPDVIVPHRRLSIGMQDPGVREAQRKLNLFHASELSAGRPGLDNCPLKPDCIFGQLTQNATRSFQQRVFPGQPREWDGIIGPKTWAQLDLVQPPQPVPPEPPRPPQPPQPPQPPAPPLPPGPTPPAITFDTNPQNWFLTAQEIAAARGNVEVNRTLRVFTSNNLVEPLADGESYMRALHSDLVRTGAGDFFHFTAWRLNITQDLTPPPTPSATSPSRFDNVVRAAALRGMRPLALIWKAVAAGFSPSSVAGMVGENTAARNFFNSIGGKGVIDGRYPAAGSHHQKTAVILRDGEAVAYCGGIDVCPDRWDTTSHTSDPRRTREKFDGWHDVHVRMRGPAVLDIESNFRDRWNERETPSIIPSEPSPPPITDPMPPVAPSPGTHHVQVLRTYACIPERGLLTPTNHYNDFAPRGETTVLAGYLKAIAKAQNYIYIEDQYLVSDEFARALSRALSTINKLIILVPRDTDGFPASAFNFHQDRFLRIVRTGHPGKVHIYHPVQPSSGNPIYVHAKLMIIDDVYAAVGSPNVNRRGHTHDTEITAAVIDSDTVDGVCRYARDLRRALWGEHLRLAPTDPAIADPIIGVAEWERQAVAGTFRVRRHVPGTPRSDTSIWDIACDPDGRCRGTTTSPLLARRTAGESEMDGSEFVEMSELLIEESADESLPDSLLHDALSQTGLIWALAQPDTGRVLSAAEVFDAFLYRADESTVERLQSAFEVIALPSTPLARDLEEGDILLRRTDRGTALISVIAAPAVIDFEQLAVEGLNPDTNTPGKFVNVIEASPRPIRREDAFARRIADTEGILAADSMLLRLRLNE